MTNGFFTSTKENPYHVSAGCVVYNPETKQMLLAKKIHDRKFGFSKGTLEPNESLEACAQRETLEEVGYSCEIEKYLGAIHYEGDYPDHHFEKTVHFFLARVEGQRSNDYESESVWMDIAEAVKAIKQDGYSDEATIAERAAKIINENA